MLCESANEFFQFMNKSLIERLGYKTADMIIRNFRMKSTRGRYTDGGQSQGYIDWINREIGIPTKNMLVDNREHIIQHELAHGLVDQLEASDPGVTDRVWEKYIGHDTRFIHQDTFTHVHKYQHKDEVEQKEECLVEEIANRRYLERPAQVLLAHFDEMMAKEPQLAHIKKLKGLPSHLSAKLHTLYENYLDNIIYVMERQGYTFPEAMQELRQSPHGDNYGVEDAEDQKMLDYVEERARKLAA